MPCPTPSLPTQDIRRSSAAVGRDINDREEAMLAAMASAGDEITNFDDYLASPDDIMFPKHTCPSSWRPLPLD